ncbi:M13 family metallopeptidase [Massilia pseudoviolaceinigra]|uniref:M13 family metallopeptidase n=1 Tax=Massilia pseudoviolaceinigra TaxID=3057165 RepID=UPI002796B686|nr:M13 family metallopeptidase [Massilia sp. CCM 9206]MDQ1924433.1 M13 family metallopeptidase [Massilia sp. CCM 9206]
MKTNWTPIKTALSLALCGASLAFAPAHGAGQDAAPAAKAVTAPVLPGNDFFAYANGDWLAKTEIPADRSSWGAFAAMAETSNARIVKLIDEVAADKKAKGEARKVADFYSTFMDEAAIEAKGTAPLKPLLAKIDAIKDKAQLVRALGASLRADVDPLNATNFFTENLFGLWVAQGLNEPARNTPYLLQGGLGMPDRAYYLTDSARMAELRTKYKQHIGAMLKLAGYPDADARAARVFDLEMKIAQSHASREDSADVLKANNSWTLKDFAANAPGMDWAAFFKSAGLTGAQNFIVWHPGAMKGAAALVDSTDIATWKDFLAFHQVNHFAPALPKAFADQRFEFSGKAMSGTPQQSPRWKRALAATNDALDEAVGRMYVERHFPAENKARVQKMVSNIIAAFSKRIDQLDWMAPATRAQAQEKLKTMYVGVAYPDRWRSYAGLKVVPGDALGNAVRAEQFHYAQEIARLKQKVDRTAWAMPPQLVNAVNLPLQNAMNFPAAILQPPFFDPKASDGENYGAIGSIIGHEISHSFDDQGAQFDAQGRLRDWWTKEDMAHFKGAADKLVAQFSAYKPFPDLAVNGQLTLSENLADLAGVAASYDAYKASLGQAAPADADKQFFLGYARAWQTKVREAAARQRILTDGHAPAEYRTAIVRNLEPWYKAFDVKPGQALYLAPAERVRVW